RDRTFIHRIDSNIDRERAKVVSDLLFTGAVRSLALVGRPDLPTGVSNATGDVLTTDGQMAVLLF
ncbi:MAG: LssY C-terminal domain-containing protein, partial [Acidobacteriota bacterium]